MERAGVYTSWSIHVGIPVNFVANVYRREMLKMHAFPGGDI